MSISLTILAIIPGILIALWMFYRDMHEKEPIWLLLLCFIGGVLSAIPAIIMEEFGMSLGIVESPDMGMTALLSWGVVGFSEEWVKFCVVMLFAFPWKPFNEPMDGIVYAVMVSLGFATIENILYADLYGLETVIIRAFTAVPAHAAFGILMGYHIGIGKFYPGKWWHIPLGLFWAIFFHGAYDFFLLQQNYPPLTILAFVTLAICIIYTRRLIKIHNENSPFKIEKA